MNFHKWDTSHTCTSIQMTQHVSAALEVPLTQPFRNYLLTSNSIEIIFRLCNLYKWCHISVLFHVWEFCSVLRSWRPILQLLVFEDQLLSFQWVNTA